MSSYPEIQALQSYLDSFTISISSPMERIEQELFFVQFTVDGASWTLLVYDEYDDYSKNKLLDLYLVLNALEDYKESDDFLVWCNEYFLDPSNTKWLDYYKSLGNHYTEIESILGKIDPCISTYDYTLRTGVVQTLLGE